jgi:hypothetical protein
VTPEEEAAAMKLKLPANFYSYLRKPPCPGCAGCETDSDPEVEVLNIFIHNSCRFIYKYISYSLFESRCFVACENIFCFCQGKVICFRSTGTDAQNSKFYYLVILHSLHN